MVEETGGVFEEKETVEKRRLAYKIKHETHGIYVARRFELDSEKIGEISRKANLYTGILRFIVSRADELPELKSKEERINEATSKSQEEGRKVAAEEKKVKEETLEAPSKPKEEKTEEKKEEPKPEEKEKKEAGSDDDIDKKLEEILNI